MAQRTAVNLERRTATGAWARFGGAAHPDARGHYAFTGLPDGQYVVFAALPMSWVQTPTSRTAAGGPLLFAPGTPRVASARVLTINGQTRLTHIDIGIPPDSVGHVTGFVVDAGGRPVTGALVRLYPTGEPSLSRAMPLDSDGHFDFDRVSPERYTVRASRSKSPVPTPADVTADVTVSPKSDPASVRLTLK